MSDFSRMSFLGSGLTYLRGATVTVVGCGGGGSHIVQQLAHLGVGTIIIVDHDRIEKSNVTRLVCSDYADVGKYKVTKIARRLRTLTGRIVPVTRRVQSDEAREFLQRSDIVFGAVDGMRTRDYVERICRAALVPYIDIGLTIVMSDDAIVQGIGGQVFSSIPGGPCLWCASILTDDALARDREEYVAGAPEQQVISMNGILASQAVNVAIWLLTRFAPSYPPPAHVLYDGLEHRMLPNNHLTMSCRHYPIDAAGWSVVLPAKKIANA